MDHSLLFSGDRGESSIYTWNGEGPSGLVQVVGTLYHRVDVDNIPSGYTSVPVM